MYIRFLFLGYRIFCFLFRPVRMGVRVMMIQDSKVTLVRQTYLPGWFMRRRTQTRRNIGSGRAA
ncbi:hypothetical protein [Candidatus Villigracilis affinis]|uniref:hypothetical protein n=1 Tax=Candidatus Villigracilis affinis TaxID=3140682 RepID=UPI001D2B7ADA|nr:hypothetical protein [Anaerolineales bacterium]